MEKGSHLSLLEAISGSGKREFSRTDVVELLLNWDGNML
jgi:hypothetical protein